MLSNFRCLLNIAFMAVFCLPASQNSVFIEFSLLPARVQFIFSVFVCIYFECFDSRFVDSKAPWMLIVMAIAIAYSYSSHDVLTSIKLFKKKRIKCLVNSLTAVAGSLNSVCVCSVSSLALNGTGSVRSILTQQLH